MSSELSRQRAQTPRLAASIATLAAALAGTVVAVAWWRHHTSPLAAAGGALRLHHADLPTHVGSLPQPAGAAGAGNSSGAGEPIQIADDFVVIGVFAARDPRAGAAIIGRSAQTAAVHGTDSELAPGVFLREVYADYVVLEHGGVRERLRVTGGVAQQLTSAGSSDTAAASHPVPAAGAADALRAAPTTPTDEVQGVRVFPGRNRGAFAQLGLHPGDLVTEVNGMAVGGHGNVDILKEIGARPNATLTVFRAGRLQQITIGENASQSATTAAP